MPRHSPLALCSLKFNLLLEFGMHFVKDKMQHCIVFFTELTVKKDLFYIDARARYAILKELRRVRIQMQRRKSGIPLSQNEREDDKSLVLFRNTSR